MYVCVCVCMKVSDTHARTHARTDTYTHAVKQSALLVSIHLSIHPFIHGSRQTHTPPPSLPASPQAEPSTRPSCHQLPAARQCPNRQIWDGHLRFCCSCLAWPFGKQNGSVLVCVCVGRRGGGGQEKTAPAQTPISTGFERISRLGLGIPSAWVLACWHAGDAPCFRV